jgi:hypothetical protein
MRTTPRQCLRRLHKGRRGQSLVTYAIITAFLLGSLTFMSIKIFPQMLNAIDQFARSMYLGINMPFP